MCAAQVLTRSDFLEYRQPLNKPVHDCFWSLNLYVGVENEEYARISTKGQVLLAAPFLKLMSRGDPSVQSIPAWL